MKQPQRDFSAQTGLITTTSLPQVSLLENYQPKLNPGTNRRLTPWNPLKEKEKKETLPIVIIEEMYSVWE